MNRCVIVLWSFMLFIFLPIIISCSGGSAKRPEDGRLPAETCQRWQKTFGGPSNESGRSGQQTSDGGYIVVGVLDYSATLLIKVDACGEEEWRRTFDDPDVLGGYDIAQTADEGYVIATGRTREEEEELIFETFVLKTDSHGKEQWRRIIHDSEIPLRVLANTTNDGWVVLTYAEGPEETDVSQLIKMRSDGSEIWRKVVGDPFDGTGQSVEETADGGYILAGIIMQHNDRNKSNLWLIKTDANGNEEWARTFGEARAGRHAIQTTDKGFIAVGVTGTVGSAGESDISLVKTDSEGRKEWNRTFGGPANDSPRSVIQTDDGGYMIIGNTDSFGAGSGDIWLIKTDANGTEQWSRTYGGSEIDSVSWGGQKTTCGGYIIFGITCSFSEGKTDIWLIKTDSEGNTGEE